MKIIFYDGECGLCHGFVQFVIKRDQKRGYHFAPLQGGTAQTYGVVGDKESIALVDSGRVLFRSDAVLEILRGLGFPWKLMSAFKLCPRFVRDWFYRRVAANRLSFAGKRDCSIPSQADRKRFLP